MDLLENGVLSLEEYKFKLTFKLHLEIFFVLKEIIIIKGIKMADQLRDKIDIEGSKIENRLFIISSG